MRLPGPCGALRVLVPPSCRQFGAPGVGALSGGPGWDRSAPGAGVVPGPGLPSSLMRYRENGKSKELVSPELQCATAMAESRQSGGQGDLFVLEMNFERL